MSLKERRMQVYKRNNSLRYHIPLLQNVNGQWPPPCPVPVAPSGLRYMALARLTSLGESGFLRTGDLDVIALGKRIGAQKKEPLLAAYSCSDFA